MWSESMEGKGGSLECFIGVRVVVGKLDGKLVGGISEKSHPEMSVNSL